MKTKIFTLLLILATASLTLKATTLTSLEDDGIELRFYTDSTCAVMNAPYVDGDVVLKSTYRTDYEGWENVNFKLVGILPQAFGGESTMTSLYIPNGVYYIGENAFVGCSSLHTISLPAQLDTIRVNTFAGCNSLISISIPSNVKSIEKYAFGGCTSLTSIEIPNSVTSIGDEAFFGCTGLTSVTIGNGVTSIGNLAFKDCSGLTSVTIPNNVISIGGDAFSECANLKSIIIGSGVIEGISTMTFAGSDSLSTIIVAEGNTKYDSRNNCNAIIETASNTLLVGGINTIIPDGVKRIDEGAFFGKDVSSIEIPNSVTFIGARAFCNTKLKTITIPINVDTISFCVWGWGGTFSSDSLKSIVWNAKHVDFINSYSSSTYLEVLYAPNLMSLTIGEDVEYFSNDMARVLGNSSGDKNIISITWNAKKCYCEGVSPFRFLPHISTITFGNKVEKIPDDLFRIAEEVNSVGSVYYDNITSIVIPNSVSEIGKDVFCGCSNVKSIIIGSGVKEIGDGAFWVSSGITSMTCYAVEPPILNDDYLTTADTIYVPAESVNAYKAADIWKTYTILPIGAKGTVTNELQVTPATDYADIIWPAISGAASYELVIKDTHGNTICTLIFNAAGQLASIVFHAPTHNNLSQNQQATGFSFSVMGLQPGTTYNATITAKDKNGNTLDVKNISFTTEGDAPQSLDQITNAPSQVTNKVIRNGQVFILRGDKTYTLTGQEVR